MIERLLSEERYKEAEEDIISILKINPVNPKAEFLLTKAWIGMGRQERAKGRNKEAKGFFKKALSNWPLNSELQKEYTQLEEKYPSYRHEPSNVKLDKETIDLLNSIQTDIAEIKEELKRNSNEPAYTRIYPYAIVILLLIAMIELIVIIRK
ncbi:hypothetical protein EHO58_19010 [Leptospira selangorensis]|uniref:hypothetical protein n=1 Tax=Leptospira selangorensis TaxID=2484982 RepID=UPI001083EFD5|nr:hypothetical protein [Leptospira selangorensis]TGK00541.1 hypothetical protein EHO58_19010 [Leptospira selangorensis]